MTTATKVIKFSNLPIHNAVQTIYVGSSYIYALQRYNEDAYLSRCNQSGECKDYMYLTRFGHSETLQWFSHKGVGYFWIGTNAKQTIKTSNTYWATQLARVAYDPSKSNKGDFDYTDATRLSSVIRANSNGSAKGDLTRFEAALSSSSATPSKKQELLVLSVNNSSPRLGNYTVYDNEALNNLLDKHKTSTGKNYLTFADVTSTVVASLPLNVIHAYPNSLPYNSIQGLEFSNGRAMYFTGGNKGTTPKISKTLFKNPLSLTSKSISIGSNLGPIETEGMQLKGDDIYFGIAEYTGTSVSDNYIYKVPKSIF